MTNLEMVTSALRMLGVLDANETANSEDGAVGLEQLNDFFSLLLADSIDLGFTTQDDLADTFPLDDTTAAQIKPLLAIHLHTFFPSSVVPNTLPLRADAAMSQLRRTAVLANMEEADLRHIPLGEGNRARSDIINDQ
jgi:hypothetical protein